MAYKSLSTEPTASSGRVTSTSYHDIIDVVTPHILGSESSSKPAAASSSTTSDDATYTSTSNSTSSVAGGALGIILIVVIILSIMSCVAGCVWKCCIRKARPPQATQANPNPAPVLLQYNPQTQSTQPANYGYNPDISMQRGYSQGENDITMDEINAKSASSQNMPSTTRRFQTIPEHEDMHVEKLDALNQHEPNVSPRKGYFYQDQVTGEYPGYEQ